MIIKVIEKPHASAAIGPWLISLIAIVVTAFSLFSTKRIFVDIKVIDDQAMYVPSTFDQSSLKRTTKTLGDGRQIRLDDFIFEGAALLKSSKTDNLLTLANSSVSNFAKAAVSFDPGLNLSSSKLTFWVKGIHGQENFAVAMKDEGNLMAFPKGKYYPFPLGLTNDWQKVEIASADFLANFDSKNIAGLRFEFGTKEIGNKAGDVILIKDLSIEPIV